MKIKNQNGIALILVVSIMAVLASIAAAFSYSMIMDQRAAANYMTSIKADYVAKAGIQHAIGVLKMDGDVSNNKSGNYCMYEGYDWYGDDWGYDSSLFGIDDTVGGETCISNDDNIASSHQPTDAPAGSDSHWINMYDSQENLIGRYAVLVIDESGKMNINTAGVDSYGEHGWTTKEIRLDKIFTAGSQASAILSARYGAGNSPGISGEDDNHDSVVLDNDGIDNDGDNDVDSDDPDGEGTDDPAEFYIARPYTEADGLSADTPFVTVGEIVSFAGLSSTDYNDSSQYITTFSSDKNLTDSGLARLNINAVSSAMELYSVLRDVFDTSVTDSELAQMAVNIIDYRDRDNGSTRIDIEGPGSTVLTRYGVEGIRINEVMVRPVFREPASDTVGDGSKISADLRWEWIVGSSRWESTDADDTDIFEWTTIPAGTYKLTVYGVGGVDIGAKTSVTGGTDWLPNNDESSLPANWYGFASDYADCDTVVISDIAVGIQIKLKNITGGTARFDSAVFSQSPDCEYVELVNISPNPIDISGWNLEFPNGQVGTVSQGTDSILAGDYAVLAVDKDDTYNNAGIWHDGAGNGISVMGTWDNIQADSVYQLTFSNTIQDNILCDTALMDSPLRLYDGPIAPTTSPTGASSPAGHIVDQVLWDSQVVQAYEFYSMERNDPTYMWDDVLNDSGIFDSWLIHQNSATDPLLVRGTPGSINEPMGGGLGSNIPGTNVSVKNSPFANIGEIADVSDTAAWENIGFSAPTPAKVYKVRAIADKITVSARRLDAEFATHTPEVSPNWTLETLLYNDDEVKRKYGRELYSDTDELYWFRADSADEDTWTWYTTRDRFEADTYVMYVYGREGGAMRVRVRSNDKDDSAIIIPSSDYGARFGQVVVSDTTLSVAIQADASSADSVFFDYILLTPASKTYGRININTADTPVLQGLQGVGPTVANNIVSGGVGYGRPFKSIGEILDVDEISISRFQKISNLITTKSNVFKIICTGQSILDKNGNGTFDTDDEVLGERKITVIYER